jgi:hypothetical protein
MASQRVPVSQQKLTFIPITSSTRQTPRRNLSLIQNYSQYERIDEPIVNPPKTPKTVLQATQALSEGDEDVEIEDREEEDTIEIDESSSDEEVVQPSDTPTRRNLPSTITVKRHKRE